jgi:hypothetical protein
MKIDLRTKSALKNQARNLFLQKYKKNVCGTGGYLRIRRRGRVGNERG